MIPLCITAAQQLRKRVLGTGQLLRKRLTKGRCPQHCSQPPSPLPPQPSAQPLVLLEPCYKVMPPHELRDMFKHGFLGLKIHKHMPKMQKTIKNM